jgi:hypothetical protein
MALPEQLVRDMNYDYLRLKHKSIQTNASALMRKAFVAFVDRVRVEED